MSDPMPQLIRQLNHQMSQLEKENQRLKQELQLTQVLLSRCLKIIEATLNDSSQ